MHFVIIQHPYNPVIDKVAQELWMPTAILALVLLLYRLYVYPTPDAAATYSTEYNTWILPVY